MPVTDIRKIPIFKKKNVDRISKIRTKQQKYLQQIYAKITEASARSAHNSRESPITEISLSFDRGILVTVRSAFDEEMNLT